MVSMNYTEVITGIRFVCIQNNVASTSQFTFYNSQCLFNKDAGMKH